MKRHIGIAPSDSIDAGARMTLPLKPPFPPMEARSVEKLPVGPEWHYEPKWDGFRCIAYRDADKVFLQSKSGQPLARYFPDLVESLRGLPAERFVLDGEIVIAIAGRLSFDELLLRIHPAESRVRKLAAEHPAMYITFDLLVDERGKALIGFRLSQRRSRLVQFAKRNFGHSANVYSSPATEDVNVAKGWFKTARGNLDGVVAKRLDLEYRSGERDGMQKVKPRRTADCVLGGFRYASSGTKVVGSLLLGLYDQDKLLHHVGFTSSIKSTDRKSITATLRSLIAPPGFTGRAPGGPSRWSTRRSTEWEPLKPKLVVEVEYDHFTGGRFRHGTKFVRWRPDKAPHQCTMDQVDRRRGDVLKLLEKSRSPKR